jgi:outer membrane autotransporter protein
MLPIRGAGALFGRAILIFIISRCSPQIALACDRDTSCDPANNSLTNTPASNQVHLNLVLGGDDSATDKLWITGQRSSGSTELLFYPQGGSGAQTDSGILIAESIYGGTTAEDSYFMRGSLSAGPYEYFLFRGAGSEDTQHNWYLRSSLIAGSGGTRSLEYGADASPIPLGPAPVAGTAPVPLYRPEIPLYAQAKALARQLSLQEISDYHGRRGEQRNWSSGEHSSWVRLYGSRGQFDWGGDVYSRFDGHFSGFQLGRNLYANPTCSGGAREAGLIVGSSRAEGDVSGFARGFSDYSAGRNQLNSYYLGWYFNDYSADQSYLDVAFKAAYLELESQSSRGIGDTIRGPQLTLSLEKGFTLTASEHLNLEPQLQLVINYTNLRPFKDGISTIEPDMTPEVTFRAGLRAYNSQGDQQYYLFGNLWHTLDGSDQLLFNTRVRLDSERGASWAEAGAGAVLQQWRNGSAFLNLGYQRSIDNLDWEGASANLGFNWAW